MRENTETAADDARAEFLRVSLAKLVQDARYSLAEISRRSGYPYRTVQRYFAEPGKGSRLPPLPFMITVLGLMSDDGRVPEVESIGQWFDDTLREFRD